MTDDLSIFSDEELLELHGDGELPDKPADRERLEMAAEYVQRRELAHWTSAHRKRVGRLSDRELVEMHSMGLPVPDRQREQAAAALARFVERERGNQD